MSYTEVNIKENEMRGTLANIIMLVGIVLAVIVICWGTWRWSSISLRVDSDLNKTEIAQLRERTDMLLTAIELEHKTNTQQEFEIDVITKTLKDSR